MRLYQEQKFDKARQLLERLVEVKAKIVGTDHPSTLKALNDLAIIYQEMGDPLKAFENQTKVLDGLSRSLGEQHPDTLVAKSNLAGMLSAIGDLAGARTQGQEALATLSKILGKEHPYSLKAKVNLARSLSALGDFVMSRTLFEETVVALSRTIGEEHPDTFRAKLGLAGTLKSLGDLDGARAQEEETFIALGRILGQEHPDTLKAKLSLAETLFTLGDIASARGYFEEVVVVLSRVLGKKHPDTLRAKSNLAGALKYQGDFPGARARFEEVSETLGRVLGDKHPDTLKVKLNLALTFKSLGDLAGARARFEEVLDAFSQSLGRDHPDTLKAKSNLASTLFAMGSLTDARAYYEDVLSARSQTLGEEHPDTLLDLHNVAATYEAMGDLEQARSLYQRIIHSHRKTQSEDYLPVTENEATTLLSLGRVHQAFGYLVEAQKAFELSLDAIEAQTEQLDLSEETRRRYRASFQEGYHSAMAVAVARGDTALALHLSERYREGNLRSLLRTRRPDSLPDMSSEIKEQLRSIASQYDGITRALDGLHPKRNPTEYRDLVNRQLKLRRDREVIQSQWLREQFKDRHQDPPSGLPGIQSQIDPGTILLIYNVGENQTQLLVLSRKGDPVARQINLGDTSLEQQVIRFRELVSPDDLKESDPEARDQLGRWLFTKLIPPDARLESADRWLILADGPLHMLPFGALVRPEDVPGKWRYMAQHKPLHTVQSVATYADLRRRRSDRIQIAKGGSESSSWVSWVGFGDPIYPVQVSDLSRDEYKDDRRILRLGEERAIFDGLTELPNTEREVQGIISLLTEASARVHLGADATEERARADMTKAHFIHFATHGVALSYVGELGVDPMDSFLALSLFNETELRQKRLKHNGLLQAWEIIDLQLDAELVVLSACQTAIGEDRGGDGLISLSRAFQIAGARSVLASLWAVNDQSTAELMIRFYKHLLAGKSKDAALQEAQKEFIAGPIEIVDEDGNAVLHDFSHPYHWAAFQLIGDWQ